MTWHEEARRPQEPRATAVRCRATRASTTQRIAAHAEDRARDAHADGKSVTTQRSATNAKDRTQHSHDATQRRTYKNRTRNARTTQRSAAHAKDRTRDARADGDDGESVGRTSAASNMAAVSSSSPRSSALAALLSRAAAAPQAFAAPRRSDPRQPHNDTPHPIPAHGRPSPRHRPANGWLSERRRDALSLFLVVTSITNAIRHNREANGCEIPL